MTHLPSKSVAGELDILRQIRARVGAGRRTGMRLGIGDDCALLRLQAGEEVAVTTDLSIADRHFRLDWHTPESVGHRTLARGLSDLAAMGARPIAAFLSLGLPRALTVDSQNGTRSWADRFYDGLLALAATYKTPLGGGDLAESPIALADIVLVGAVPAGRALLRSGARAGDFLYVTGSIGGSAAGLEQLGHWNSAGDKKSARKIPSRLAEPLAPHLYPQPRISQGLWLQRRGVATAALDISDGLSTDLAHLCEESRVAAEVDAAALPVHPGASLAQALHGGEDYELLFAARATARLPRSIAGVAISRIGRIVARRREQPAVTLLTAEGPRPLEAQGWEHFS
jgi:thiamine-monophosphate kinase